MYAKYQGLEGSRDAVVTVPKYTLGSHAYKASVDTRLDEPPPPLIANTVHDVSSRRGVLLCDQSLVHRKLREPTLPNSASHQPPRF
jgi:hypothetical protein